MRDWLIGLRGSDQVIRNHSNVGLTGALNQIWNVAKNFHNDYVINIHNDVFIYEEAWIDKLERVITEASQAAPVGVAGFFGAFGTRPPI